jgi:hypothetical protein
MKNETLERIMRIYRKGEIHKLDPELDKMRDEGLIVSENKKEVVLLQSSEHLPLNKS